MSLIYSETGIIKQAIRDLYNRNTESIIVEGKEAYQEVLETVSEFSSIDINKVSLYNEGIPLFAKYGIEKQLKELLYERVDLPSGGYIVIQPTEALVSIDVNSGKSTAEKNIEDMALKINMEAVIEIACQLKLRDLGGLIVIDFIDMLEIRNRKTVERSLKAAFYNDRAKVQISRISIFGLLEISRQRIRSSITETNTIPCESCGGSGKVRTVEVIINNLLKELRKFNNHYKKIEVFCSKQMVSAIKNSRLHDIKKFENEHKISILLREDSTMVIDQYRIVAKKSDNDGIEILADYKGTPLSLYFYEKEKEKEKTEQVSEEFKSNYREDSRTRVARIKGYRNKDRFGSKDSSHNGKSSHRSDRGGYKGKKPYNKNYRNDRNASPKKEGIIGKIFGKLFGSKK